MEHGPLLTKGNMVVHVRVEACDKTLKFMDSSIWQKKQISRLYQKEHQQTFGSVNRKLISFKLKIVT